MNVTIEYENKNVHIIVNKGVSELVDEMNLDLDEIRITSRYTRVNVAKATCLLKPNQQFGLQDWLQQY